MPTKRSSSVAVCTGQAVIVAGGWDQEAMLVTTVEVMDIVTQEWSSAADLPIPLYSASVTICHDRVYYLGQHGSPSMTVYTCTLTDLFQS